MSNSSQKVLFVLVLIVGLWAMLDRDRKCEARGGTVDYIGRHNDKWVCND